MAVGNYINEQRFSCVGVTGAGSCPVWINSGESPFSDLPSLDFGSKVGGQVEIVKFGRAGHETLLKKTFKSFNEIIG